MESNSSGSGRNYNIDSLSQASVTAPLKGPDDNIAASNDTATAGVVQISIPDVSQVREERPDLRSLPVSENHFVNLNINLLADRLLLKTIVKSVCLSLVGADIFQVKTFRTDGSEMFLNKHVLPEPAEATPRYDSDHKLLYSPTWTRDARYNMGFIKAAVAAVEQVKVR
jgi:hypothetical protein